MNIQVGTIPRCNQAHPGRLQRPRKREGGNPPNSRPACNSGGVATSARLPATWDVRHCQYLPSTGRTGTRREGRRSGRGPAGAGGPTQRLGTRSRRSTTSRRRWTPNGFTPRWMIWPRPCGHSWRHCQAPPNFGRGYGTIRGSILGYQASS